MGPGTPAPKRREPRSPKTAGLSRSTIRRWALLHRPFRITARCTRLGGGDARVDRWRRLPQRSAQGCTPLDRSLDLTRILSDSPGFRSSDEVTRVTARSPSTDSRSLGLVPSLPLDLAPFPDGPQGLSLCRRPRSPLQQSSGELPCPWCPTRRDGLLLVPLARPRFLL